MEANVTCRRIYIYIFSISRGVIFRIVQVQRCRYTPSNIVVILNTMSICIPIQVNRSGGAMVSLWKIHALPSTRSDQNYEIGMLLYPLSILYLRVISNHCCLCLSIMCSHDVYLRPIGSAS